jgi:CheY-like chemotaxis protein/DNA-directed RNA polymerase specialized sigma24 family protein
MSLSAIIAAHLPYLRRYARALSGSQESGDAYVVAMLETLVEDPSLFDQTLEPRTALFQAFSRIWNAMPLNLGGSRHAFSSIAAKRLDDITPLPRQAFLLTAVEGFTAEQAAQVLEISAKTLSALIETAGEEIKAQVSTTALIIEDEPIIASDLEHLLKGLGHSIVGNARTRDEAVEMARREKPGLVLADIRLADGSSGLDAVRDIRQSFDIPVIFITAYPEALLTGDRPEPTYLIVKPFEEDMVRAVVSQALFFNSKAMKQSASAA